MEVKECIFSISYRFLSHTQSKKPCFISNHFIMKKYFKTVIIDPKNTPIGLNEKNISVAVSESLGLDLMSNTGCAPLHVDLYIWPTPDVGHLIPNVPYCTPDVINTI